jgi:hypothetical protein
MAQFLLAFALLSFWHASAADKKKPPKAERGVTTSVVHITEMLDVFPLPGQLVSVHAVNTVKDGKPVKNVRGIIVQGADPTWHVTFPDEAPVPAQDSNMAVAPTKGGFFLAASEAGLPVEMKIINDSGKLILDMRYLFANALRTGRVLRFAKGETRLQCFRPDNLDQPTFEIHYTFGENAAVRWDSAQSKLVWSGFTAEAETPRPSAEASPK